MLCLLASGVLDCCDGELARLRGTSSRLGHVLDVVGDTLVAVALLAGIALRLLHAGTFPGWPALVALLLGVAGAFAVVTWSEATAVRRRRVARWENGVLDGVLGPLTTRDWYVFPVAFALAGRLGWLVPAAAVGAHVFWLVTLVLLLRVLRAAQLQGSAAARPPVALRRLGERGERIARVDPTGACRARRRATRAAPIVAAPESTTSTNGCASAKAIGEAVERQPAARPRAAVRAARASSGRSFASVSRPLACTSFTMTPRPASCAAASAGARARARGR